MRYKVNKEVVIPTKHGTMYLNKGQFYNTANDSPSGCGKKMLPMLQDYGFIEECSNVWQPREGQVFWFIYADDRIGSKEYDGRNDIHIRQLEVGNYFEHKWQAEAELAKRKAKVILLKDSKGYHPDPNDQELVYQVRIKTGTSQLDVAQMRSDYVYEDGIFFYTYAAAAKSMEKHRKEWLTLFNLYGETKDEEIL